MLGGDERMDLDEQAAPFDGDNQNGALPRDIRG